MSGIATRVHLTGSSRNPAEDLPYLRQIISTVHECQGSIVLNWIETAHFKSKDSYATWDWNDIVNNNVDALKRAHVVIIEGTSHGLLQGYQLALALERRLPVLFLTRESIDTLPISGIKSRLLLIKAYKTTADLQKVITKFMEANSQAFEQPPLSETTRRFLKNQALVTGQTEAAIIDQVIQERLGRL